MRRWMIGCLMAGIACASAAAETPQSDRRNRQFPELVVESQGRRATCDVLTFTRDGKHLLAVGDDKVVRVWEYRDGQLDPRSLKMLRWSVWGPQRGAIYALSVSPDPQGQRVAIGGVGIKTTAAAVIDRASGEILATIYANDHPAAPKKGGFQSVRAITFSPRGDRIAFGSADGSVWLWCYERKGKEELKWLGAHSSAKDGLFNRVRLLRFLSERTLLSVAQNGEVFQWDVTAEKPEPERLKWLDDVGGPIHDVLLSRDGKWLAARAMNKPRIYVRALDGKQRKDIALEEKTVAGSLAFDDLGHLAAGIRSTLKNDEGFYLESNEQLCLFDLSGENAKVSEGPPHSGRIDVLSFHPDGKHLAAAGGDESEVTFWDLRRPKERPTVLRGVGRGIWNVALSEGGRYLAFQTQRDPKPTHPNRRGRGPWTLFDLRRRQWASAPADFTPAAPLRTQDGWQVKPAQNNASIWYVARGDTQQELPWNKAFQGKPCCYAFLPRAEGQPVRLAVGHYYGVSVFEVTEKHVRPIWQGMGHEGEVMSLAVSPTGDWLVSASDDQTLSAWSLNDWPSGSELGGRFADNGKGQIVVEKVDLFGPAWEAGMSAGDQIFGLQDVLGRKVTFFRPKVDGSKSKIGSIDACLETLKHPQPGKPLIFRVKRGGNEWLNLFTSVKRRPLWRFFPTRDKEWVLWMGRNPYYETSNNGDQYIGWQLNNRDDLKKTPKFYPAEQFRNLFHKPAVIDKLLAERDLRQALNESGAGLTPPNFDKLFDTVSVRIEAREQRVDDADVQVILTIESRTENPDYAPVRAELWVNDRRLMVWPTKKGDPFPRTWSETCTIERKHLREGDNDVVLQCYNRVERRGEGRLEASTRVHCRRDVHELKRNLYGLVVGINDYSRSALNAAGKPLLHNLNTPRSDMEAIRKAWLSQRGGKLYAEVDIAFLSEKTGNTDRQTILKELKALAKKAGPDDRVFLFLAGHGMVLDPKGRRDFVFCCPDFDPRKPETYLNAGELYAALADISCRKVVFLDVCHSGEVIRPVRRLTPGGRGPTIFAACDSGESSWEPLGAKSAKHSFFVAALLEAFQSGDRDNNGKLDAHEIFEYASERVPELLDEAKLNATQTPTCFPRPLGQNVLLARNSSSPKGAK